MERGRQRSICRAADGHHDGDRNRPSHHGQVTSFSEALHCSPWSHLDQTGAGHQSGAHVERAGAFYMAVQMEAGHCCPITMTNAAVPTLLRQPDLAKAWLPRILARTYDPAFAPAAKKTSVTFGMAGRGCTRGRGSRREVARSVRALLRQRPGPPEAPFVSRSAVAGSGRSALRSRPLRDFSPAKNAGRRYSKRRQSIRSENREFDSLLGPPVDAKLQIALSHHEPQEVRRQAR